MAAKQSVIVLGLGIAGSSIAAALATRGHHVTAIEQFGPLNDRGSSHGDTRIYRRVPHEGKVYVEMANISQQGWRAWNKASRENLYIECGGIDAGPEDSHMVAAAEKLCREYHQPFQLFSGSAFNGEHPHFKLPSNWRVVYQPASGVVRPDATRTFLHQQARESGARLLFHATVLGIEPSSTNVSVQTTHETLVADALIIAAGSWLPKLLPELKISLSIERRVLAWFHPSASADATTHHTHQSISNSPIFVFDADGGWYGMPTPGSRIKLGHDKHLHQIIDPDLSPTIPRAEDATKLSACIRSYFRGIDPKPQEMKSCIYTLTPDHNFIIDRHPDHENMLIFSCCSGHGFKYAPAYGEIAADLLASKPRLDLTAFTLQHRGHKVTRFS